VLPTVSSPSGQFPSLSSHRLLWPDSAVARPAEVEDHNHKERGAL